MSCPQCGDGDVIKAPMAPAVPRKGNQLEAVKPVKPTPMSNAAIPPQAVQMMQVLAAMQTAALKESKWVGEDFAEVSRAIHYGERDAESVHGQATLQEAKELFDEGIAVAPLPFPVAPPGEAN